MIEHFNVVFLEEVEIFLASLNVKERKKIVFNIDKARIMLDPKTPKSEIQKALKIRLEYFKAY